MAFHFPFCVFLPERFTFIMQFFPFCEANFRFYEVFVIKIDAKGNESISFFFEF